MSTSQLEVRSEYDSDRRAIYHAYWQKSSRSGSSNFTGNIIEADEEVVGVGYVLKPFKGEPTTINSMEYPILRTLDGRGVFKVWLMDYANTDTRYVTLRETHLR